MFKVSIVWHAAAHPQPRLRRRIAVPTYPEDTHKAVIAPMRTDQMSPMTTKESALSFM